MDALDAIRNRASTRAFLDQPVSRESVRQVLDTARWAPSGVNSQPWRVVAVRGDIKQEIGDTIVAAIDAGQKPNPDYRYYADRFPEPYRSRQIACGQALYGALEIKREDKETRRAQWMKNYHGFGSRVELLVFIDDSLETGSWLDTGMFIQNIMLAAKGVGLDTCPQAAMAEFPDITRKILELPPSRLLVCGIALGHADPDAPVNNYRTERAETDDFTQWIGFGDE